MKKISNRKLSIIVYLITLISLTINQICQYNDVDRIELIMTITIITNIIVVTLFLINVYVFTTFKEIKIKKLSVSTIIMKISYYFVINILSVNKITTNLLSVIIFVITILIIVTDLIINNKLYQSIKELEFNGSEDLRIESKENRLRILENSEDFKSFQLNVLNYICAIIVLYLSSLAINILNNYGLIFYGATNLIAIIFCLRYVNNLSKYYQIRWYHYLLALIGIIFASIVIFYKFNLLIILIFVPLIPLIKIESKIRKRFLNK